MGRPPMQIGYRHHNIYLTGSPRASPYNQKKKLVANATSPFFTVRNSQRSPRLCQNLSGRLRRPAPLSGELFCKLQTLYYKLLFVHFFFHLFQTHGFIFKEEGRHDFDFVDDRREAHLVEDVFLEVDARGDFGQVDTVFFHFEYGTFCDVEDMLFMFTGIVAAEGDVTDFGNEFLDFPFLQDVQFTVFDFFAEFPCRKGPAEDDVLRILGDVDEAAAAGNARTEFGYVDIAFFIAFGQAQAGQVQAAAIVEVELCSLVHVGFGIDRSPEADAAERYAADGPGFDSHGQAVADAFFVGYGRDEFRNTDAQVDDGFTAHIEKQQGCPAGNDFLGIERSRIQGFDGNRRFARQGRVIFAVEGLLPFRFVIDLNACASGVASKGDTSLVRTTLPHSSA